MQCQAGADQHMMRTREDIVSPAANGSVEQVIRIEGLRMSYAGTEVLKGIDLTVHRGEIFAFLGPNGAGKTTTVEILEGFRRPSEGSVAVLGRNPASAGPD